LITTSAGLILIDSTYAETADHILESIRKLGFDPANVKYLLLTHQHNDHFAGAPRLKAAIPGLRVGVSAPDWDAVEKGTMIARDLAINDGDTLKLGDTTLKFYVVPGHTVGNMVTEIQARGNGRTFRTLIGVAFAPAPGMTEASIKSTERLKQLGPWDSLLTSHSYLAPVAIPLTAQQILSPAAPSTRTATGHPAAQGADRINTYFDQILKATRDRLAREQAQATQAPTR
jgi:metallo-beta-lactamase class B